MGDHPSCSSPKGRQQVEKYGTVPAAFGAEPAEHEGQGHYLGTLVDGGKYYAPGYWARGAGPVKLTGHALHMLRGGAARPVLVLRQGIRRVERRARFAGRGGLGTRISVIHWEMGGGRFIVSRCDPTVAVGHGSSVKLPVSTGSLR